MLNDRNSQAEYSLIGAVLIDSRVLEKVQGTVTSADFTIPLCATVWDMALDRVTNGKSFDPIVAFESLKKQIGDESAKNFISECMEITPTVATASRDARIVRWHSDTRQIKSAVLGALQTSTEASEIAATIAGISQDFITRHTTSRFTTLTDAMVKMVDAKNEKQTSRVDTGFPHLDGILKGLWSGNLVVIGARPGVGKSAFAMEIARSVASQSGRVLIYSYEMESEEIAERYLSQATSISMDKLIDNTLSEQEWQKIALMSDRLSKLPISINDDPRTTIADVRTQARILKDLKLIVIDYLTLIPSDGTGKKFERRDLEIANYTRKLKLLAKELRVPIIALSQLNRENDETDEPSLRSLRDSGGIEQDANKVLFLWKLDETGQRIGVKVAKNRRGKTGTVAFEFNGQFMRYIERPNWEVKTPKNTKFKGIED